MPRPQLFTRTREWPILTNTSLTRDKGPSYNFLQRVVKNWLKIWHISSVPVTSDVKGIPPWNFATWWAIRGGAWSLMYKFLEAHTPPISRAKKSKIWPDFRQLSTLTAKEKIEISKTGNKLGRHWSLLGSAKNGELWSTNKKSYNHGCWRTLSRQCTFCIC